ncbi:Rho-binding antiterminator [Hymenobacter luteus]|uniref:Rho-binding antiterminator n=2 Tax=Hymenobacter TaxID=89966 RepID=A0A7W9T481_9BACT|nr:MULTISPECIES: hypothetical protein [Hymenobacter]MBB4603241.1 Rho-binding antiterminator [Hymenobacter latericoloratus]MBB6060139.1 Rho-binding antiterminator [Hymenobacter luteus]
MSAAQYLLHRSLPAELQLLLGEGRRCLLVYRTPGTSAEFSVRGQLLGVLRRGQTDYLRLASGCELRLDWLVAVNGHRLAA